MADKLISFAHRIGGVLTDVTAAKLRDATAAYGLRLAASPFTVVVAAGTNLAHDGTGLYSHAATGLTAGTDYQYALEWVYGGETKRQVRTFTAAAAATYAGRYTDSDAVRTWLGTINADVYADLDADGLADAGAWQQAIQWGEDELDLYAAGGPAGVPLAFAGGTAGQQGVATRVIQRWATVLSGWHLFFKRPAAQGTLLTTPAAAQAMATLDGAKKAVLAEIAAWRAGGLLLPGLTPAAAAADDTPEPGQFQFASIDRGNACNGDEFGGCG